MSPKHVKKSCGFAIVCLVTLTIWIIFCASLRGLADEEPSTTQVDLQMVEVEIPESVILQIRDAGPILQSLVEEAKEAEVENEPEPEPLSGPALYLQYVDEITSTIYTDLDPVRVKAIIYHESRYQPETVNKKTGVVGLMQISPKWHTKRARNLGVSDLKDPYGNILVGCDILHEMMQGHSMDYATNVFAGGYKYANSYKNGVSPYVRDIRRIEQKLRTGELVIGGD